MSDYIIRGREIYSAKGKCVATLDDNGNPVMAPGMAGAHSRGVQEFLEILAGGNGTSEESPEVAQGEDPAAPDGSLRRPGDYEGQAAVASPGSAGVSATRPESDFSAEWEISTIPEDRLPPFSKALGVNTSGFSEYIVRHKLTMPQVAALIKRLSR